MSGRVSGRPGARPALPELALKPDFAEVAVRYDAFWHQAIVDRPLVSMSWRTPEARRRRPIAEAHGLPPVDPDVEPTPEMYRTRWLDVKARAARTADALAERHYHADSLPIAWPNMGPEIFSAWCGCPYQFGRDTTWTEPCITDWQADGHLGYLDPNHPLLLKTIEFTEELLRVGAGRFIVGLTDFHPGGDHLAALRDPANLAIDLIDNPDVVKERIAVAAEEYESVYERFYRLIADAGMPATSWIPLIHFGTFYIPSNDFSGLISPAMFEEFFLDGIIRECRYLDRSIYHLDGPGALCHLDALLSIPELDAIQWVPGAGNEQLERWIPVYQRIQAAGKSMQVLNVTTRNLDMVLDNLRPDGVWIDGVHGVDDEETANAVMRRIERWR